MSVDRARSKRPPFDTAAARPPQGEVRNSGASPPPSSEERDTVAHLEGCPPADRSRSGHPSRLATLAPQDESLLDAGGILPLREATGMIGAWQMLRSQPRKKPSHAGS